MLNNRETIRFVYDPLLVYSEKETAPPESGAVLNYKVLE